MDQRLNRFIFIGLITISLTLFVVSLYITSVSQLGILLFGMPALFLAGYKEHNTRRWAYVLGCLGQPFWFITTISNYQWGMLILCLFYSGSWANGAYRHWIK